MGAMSRGIGEPHTGQMVFQTMSSFMSFLLIGHRKSRQDLPQDDGHSEGSQTPPALSTSARGVRTQGCSAVQPAATADTSTFANGRGELPWWLNVRGRVSSKGSDRNKTHLTARLDIPMPLETNSHAIRTTKRAASAKYALHIPTGVGRRLKRCRESVRSAIRTQLQDIADAAATAGKVKLLANRAPALRFYINESYKVLTGWTPRPVVSSSSISVTALPGM